MSRKGALLPSFFRKGRESMKKKYVSAMVLTALLGAQCFAGEAEAAVAFKNESSAENINISGAYDVGIYNNSTDSSNYTGNIISVDTTPGDSWGNGNVGVYASNQEQNTTNSVINLGAISTESIRINVVDKTSGGYPATGLWADGKPGNYGGIINVKGKNLVITGDAPDNGIYGIYAQNNSLPGSDDASKSNATINIDADNTYINVTSANGGASGIVAMSQGIVNINSNLEVHADDAIVTRGNSIININTDGQHSTKLYGDVNFNYDFVTSQTVIDSQVNINLTGADSIWEGNTRFSWTAKGNNRPTNEDLAVNSMHLTIADGAQWTPNAVPVDEEDLNYGDNAPDHGADDYVETNQVTLNDGIINIKGSAVQDGKHTGITIGNLNGTGGTINLESDDHFTTRELNIKAAGSAQGETQSSPTKLTVNFTGINADDIAKSEGSLEKLAGNVKFGTDKNGISGDDLTVTANVKEGLIRGDLSANIITTGTGSETGDGSVPGHIVLKDVHQNSSTTTMENMKNIAAVSIAAWRQEDSTLSQRLGDLRETTGGQGIWARVSRGEFEYSGEFKNQYNYFQIGWDMAKDDWHYGAAVSYNDGETTYSDGNGENSSTSLSLYGTRLLNDGQYFDIVLKAGRLNNKYDNYAVAGHTHGDYDAWGTEISGEYGKKIDLANDWFVTPQAQLSLMRIGSEDYTTSNGIHVDQDTLYSAVGRIGAEAGKKTAWGSLYAKASVLHDFAGDADTYLTTYRGLSNSYSQDIGDTWYEAGFGANWKMSSSSYLYVDVIRTFGGDIKTPWQWNAGVRWGF